MGWDQMWARANQSNVNWEPITSEADVSETRRFQICGVSGVSPWDNNDHIIDIK